MEFAAGVAHAHFPPVQVPLQHSYGNEQAAPMAAHAHWPPLHVPLQQSEALWQVAPVVLQQRPLRQSVCEIVQQSVTSLHAPPVGAQQL